MMPEDITRLELVTSYVFILSNAAELHFTFLIHVLRDVYKIFFGKNKEEN